MDKYEIHIGKFYDLEHKTEKTKQRLVITGEQLEIIKLFASTRKDKDLNTIYKLNECEFEVMLHIDISKYNSPTPRI